MFARFFIWSSDIDRRCRQSGSNCCSSHHHYYTRYIYHGCFFCSVIQILDYCCINCFYCPSYNNCFYCPSYNNIDCNLARVNYFCIDGMMLCHENYS